VVELERTVKQRAIFLKKLKNLVIRNAFKYCPDFCFRVLYGLPAQLQIELSTFMIKRYLPYFKKNGRITIGQVRYWIMLKSG
jgi:hypothetical protein